jgi:hypothetical protein
MLKNGHLFDASPALFYQYNVNILLRFFFAEILIAEYYSFVFIHFLSKSISEEQDFEASKNLR